MLRAMIGASVGVASCLTALAGYGAWWGLTQGVDWRHPLLPPGWDTAVNATALLLVFWWAAVVVGGVIGGLAGFGSWLVRPRGRLAVA